MLVRVCARKLEGQLEGAPKPEDMPRSPLPLVWSSLRDRQQQQQMQMQQPESAQKRKIATPYVSPQLLCVRTMVPFASIVTVSGKTQESSPPVGIVS